MPWKPKDATRHTKKAKSAKSQRQWKDVANGVLSKTGDEGRAVREANAVVARTSSANSETNAYNWRNHVGRPKKRG